MKKKRDSFGKKKAKKNGKKKHVGKVKAEFSTSLIFKKNLTKIILKKKHVGKQ
jgi:hypothetical protein